MTGGRASNGGGIFNNGTLSLNSTVVSGNRAIFTAGGTGGGGGINNDSGVLRLTRSTINTNTAPGGGTGGGIYNASVVTRIGSTITGNTPNNCAGPAPVPGCVG